MLPNRPEVRNSTFQTSSVEKTTSGKQVQTGGTQTGFTSFYFTLVSFCRWVFLLLEVSKMWICWTGHSNFRSDFLFQFNQIIIISASEESSVWSCSTFMKHETWFRNNVIPIGDVVSVRLTLSESHCNVWCWFLWRKWNIFPPGLRKQTWRSEHGQSWADKGAGCVSVAQQVKQVGCQSQGCWFSFHFSKTNVSLMFLLCSLKSNSCSSKPDVQFTPRYRKFTSCLVWRRWSDEWRQNKVHVVSSGEFRCSRILYALA